MAGEEITGCQKVLKKLEATMEEGNFYEAQQLYKSLFARYKSQKKWVEAIYLMKEGACMQLRHKQVNCGVELGLLLVELYRAASVPVDEQSIGRIQDIFHVFPRYSAGSRPSRPTGVSPAGEGTDASETRRVGARAWRFSGEEVPELAGQGTVDSSQPGGGGSARGGAGGGQPVDEVAVAVAGCTKFLRAAIKWSASDGDGGGTGSPSLHTLLACYLWRESRVVDVFTISQHFVCGNRPELFADALVEFAQQGLPQEADLFVVRAVLQYLTRKKTADAQQLLECYCSKWPGGGQVANGAGAGAEEGGNGAAVRNGPDSPLLNFTRFLLIGLDRVSLPLVRLLQRKYRPSLDRDADLGEYMDQILSVYFHVQQRRDGGLQGALGDIMKMLFAGE
eukprot:jgi/Mesvir1/18669/Mv17168-RA.1